MNTTKTQIVLPMNGDYAHILKSVKLGTTRTQCGLSIHGIAIDESQMFGHEKCGRCFAAKTAKPVSTAKRCSDCGVSIGQSKHDQCSDCRSAL